jgi:hypothetical protein
MSRLSRPLELPATPQAAHDGVEGRPYVVLIGRYGRYEPHNGRGVRFTVRSDAANYDKF